LSDEFEKNTLPGSKSVLRVYENDEDTPSFDVICMHEEDADLKNSEKLKIWVPFTEESIETTPVKVELISQLIIDKGEIVY
jgi:hypothetical protein